MNFDRRQVMAGAILAALPLPLRAQALRPLRVVATNQRSPSAFFSLPSTLLGFKYRTLHIVGAPTAELVLGFCGWAMPSNIEIDAPAPHSYSKIAIEIGNQVVPVTFDGARGVTIAGGTPYRLSDPIPASAFGLAVFPRDMRFFVRGLGVAGPGRSLPSGSIAVGEGMRMAVFPPATAIDDIDTSGPLVVAPGFQGRSAAPGPSLVLGRPPAGHLAVICTGDSIADGAGDSARLAVGRGFFNRAAVDDAGNNAIASLNLTKSGSTAGTVTKGLGVPGAPGFAYRQAMLQFGNVLVDQLGTNTLGGTGAVLPSRVLDTARPLWALARAAGIQNVIRTSLLLETKSINRFIDAAGQTPRINWGPGEARDGVNAAFAAALGTGEIDAYVDILSAVADPADAYRWVTNGQRNYPTSDGVHPSSAMARLMAPPLRSAYLGLVVD